MGRFKSGTLACRWRKNFEGQGSDYVFWFPNKPDGGLLQHALTYVDVHCGRSLVEELERRGYDLTTLQFTIRKKEV